MNTLLIATIVGWAASIAMISGYLPQAITTIRTRNTEGIAMSTFIMFGLGSIFFVIQGLLLSNLPLVFTNVITTVCSVIIAGIKIHNDSKERREKSAK